MSLKPFRVTNISWDITSDDDDDETTPDSLGLPYGAYVLAEDESEVADLLSDEHGYCINSLDAEEITRAMVISD